MPVSSLVRAELGRHDWSRLRCGCGNRAGHIPETFERILQAESPGETIGCTLDNHLEIETNLFEVAVPAVGVLLAALAGPISEYARGQFIAVLWYVVSGDPHFSEAALGNTRLGDECRDKAREGNWVILHHAINRHDETAAEILQIIDLDNSRLDYYASRFAK